MSWLSHLFDRIENKEEQLEKARQQLVAELETGGIRNLLQQMNNHQPYHKIIIERRKRGSYSSDDDISWYAFQQSYKLNFPGDKRELLELLNNPEYADQQKNIYGCLACLCDNTGDKELFNFLMSQIESEQDDTIKIVVFSRLTEIIKDCSFNIAPLKKAVEEGSSDVRRAAIRALANACDSEVEDLLLDEFKYCDRYLKATIANTISTIGTKKSIPLLKQAHKTTGDFGLRGCIENAIEKIEEREKNANA